MRRNLRIAVVGQEAGAAATLSGVPDGVVKTSLRPSAADFQPAAAFRTGGGFSVGGGACWVPAGTCNVTVATLLFALPSKS